MTGGKIPVVYARGNHETKGRLNETLDRYVAANNGDFFYTFRLKSVWGVVLDIGENHDDDWHETFDAANFADYRGRQIEFLDNIIANKDTEYESAGVKYRIGISHIPTAFAGFGENFLFDTFVQMNARLNKMNLAVMMSGHFHRVFVTDPYPAGTPISFSENYAGKKPEGTDFIAAGAEYKNVLVARPALNQTSKKSFSHFTGSAFEFHMNELYLIYTNDKGDILTTVSAFEDKNNGKVITVAGF